MKTKGRYKNLIAKKQAEVFQYGISGENQYIFGKNSLDKQPVFHKQINTHTKEYSAYRHKKNSLNAHLILYIFEKIVTAV